MQKRDIHDFHFKLFSKKALFFTLMSLTLVSIITFIFTQSTASLTQNQATSTRIRTIDSLVTQIEDGYLPLTLQVATFKGIQSAVQYMDAQDLWLLTPELQLGAIIANGTLSANQVVMANNTLANFTRALSAQASSGGLQISMQIHSLKLNQSVPWQVDALANVSLLVISDVGMWNRSGIVITSTLPIEGLPDPQYQVRTDGVYKKSIHRSPIQPSQWNASTLSIFIASGNYTRFEGASAPSYLERFKQTPLASTCCGIESTINNSQLPLGMQNAQKSYADYQFWTMATPCPNVPAQDVDVFDISQVAGSDPFRLDFDHMIKYNVTDQATQINC